MNKTPVSLAPALVGGLALSVLTGVLTYAVTTMQTNQQIEQRVDAALQAVLPDATAEATQKIEAEKTALIVQNNLSGWELASNDVPDGRHIYGSLSAEFTLVEFSDFECSFCKRFHDTPKSVVQQSGGRVNWEWMHYPLGFHNPVSSQASHAGLCVSEIGGNKAFWGFTDSWFQHSSMGGRGAPDIAALAAGVGVEREAFNECMDSQRYADKIAEQVEKGTAMGVTGTPGTFVVDNTTGNRVFVRGAQDASVLIRALQQLQGMREQTSSNRGADGDKENG